MFLFLEHASDHPKNHEVNMKPTRFDFCLRKKGVSYLIPNLKEEHHLRSYLSALVHLLKVIVFLGVLVTSTAPPLKRPFSPLKMDGAWWHLRGLTGNQWPSLKDCLGETPENPGKTYHGKVPFNKKTLDEKVPHQPIDPEIYLYFF